MKTNRSRYNPSYSDFVIFIHEFGSCEPMNLKAGDCVMSSG